MATMERKTTSNVPFWKIYITDNPLFKTIDFVVENKKIAPLMIKKGQGLSAKKILKEGTKFKIIDKKLYIFAKLGYAKVNVAHTNGFIQINRIHKPTATDTLSKEKEAQEALDKLIRQHKMPITIILKDKGRIWAKYKGITGAQTINGTPKADFACHDINKKNIIFISHKASGGASAFQQYSGVSETAGDIINSHPEVQDFLRSVIGYISNKKLKHAVYRKVHSSKLKNLAVFGPDWKSSGIRFGEDWTQLIGQGNPILKPTRQEDTFELTFDDHLVYSGQANTLKQDFDVVLGATYRAGRGFNVDGKKYVGARVGIMSIKRIKNRSGSIEI